MTNEDNESKESESIQDIENYINERRLKQIFDIREDLHDKRRKIRSVDPTKKRQALQIYRSIVSSYIMEAEPLLAKYGGKGLLYERDFGTITISPRTYEKQIGASSTTTTVVNDPEASQGFRKITEEPEPIKIALKGSASVFQLDNPITYTFTLEEMRGNRLAGEFEHTVTTQISFQILDRMVRETNQHLAQIGFELEPEQETEPGQIEDVGL